MWKQLKISEQTYFFYCNFSEETQDLTFILYDFKITWCQTIKFKDVKHKVKVLNKRFDFNDNNIKEALTSDSIQSAVLEDANLESCLLKLKYSVKNCLLSYEWCLKKQNLLEFQKIIIQPLLLTLLECQQQIEILANSVRKKDIELKQFRIEGAVLNRKTLRTKPFDFNDFNMKFEICNKTSKNFEELAKYVKEAEISPGTEFLNKTFDGKTGRNVKPEENICGEQRRNLKMSPRQKKRKANEVKMEHLQQHLKLRRQGLEYESSQSQTMSSGSSQPVDESGMKNLQLTTAKEDEKSKAETPLSPRKNTRCSALRQNQKKMTRDSKSESDDENHLSTSSQKRFKQCSDSHKIDPRTNSNSKKTKINSINITPQEIKQTRQQPHGISKNTQSQASGESCTSSVFDFFTESDDEIPLLKRKNSQKSKRRQNSHTLSRKNITNDTSLNKSLIFDFDGVNSMKSPSPSNSLNHSSTPVIINEISSQLDNIKKELETLEAMRLADLQQRICKV